MAQDRMLRASMRESEKVNGWPIPLRYFWTQLWGYCDDHGRGRYDSKLIVAGTFPMDDEVTAEVVGRWMQALEMAGVIRAYEVADKRYFSCVHWPEHQELAYVKKTDIPDESGTIPPFGKYSAKVQKSLEDSRRIEGEVKGREVEGEATDVEPPSKCTLHWTMDNPPRCPQCGDARRKHDAWLREQKSRPTPIPRRGTPDPATCVHKYVAGWCVAGCEQAQPQAVAS